MNTWALVSLILAAVYLAGFAALVVCAKFAREGYEDPEGFHFGAEPTDAKTASPDMALNFARNAKLPKVA